MASTPMSSPRDPHRSHAASPAELIALNAVSREGSPFLAWRDHASALQLLALDGAPVTIGRSPAAGIPITWDPAVSALHGELVPVDEEWLIVDDGISTNGTFVGGGRVSGRQRLRDEDRIRVGDTLIVFHRPALVATPTAFAEVAVERSDLSQTEWTVLLALCRPIVVDGQRSPASNNVIVAEVHLSRDGAKRCLTRLYAAFGVAEDADSKRLELAHAAMNTALVTRRSYDR
ncbi:MAG: FHA domain-containing protein [Solirubrobacteraceae bacterium]